MPIEIQFVVAYLDFQIFGCIRLILNRAKDGISDIAVGKVFPIVVMTLQNQIYFMRPEQVDQCKTLLKRHVSRAGLGIVRIEEISVSDDNAVTVQFPV